MSHSIGIPGFVNERRQDILAISGLQQPVTTVGSKRDRISMYRTRSYLCYRMSRAVKERHKRGPALFTSAIPKPKCAYRRHKRLPRMLQSTFTNTEAILQTPNVSKTNKLKKQKNNVSTSTLCIDVQNESKVKGSHRKLRLNTHLWHTKRFKVQGQHDWYIPTKHKSRGMKAVDNLYDKCVIQDISYCTAHTDVDTVTSVDCGSIVVTGNIEEINSMFALFTDPLEPLITTADSESESDELIVLEAFEKEAVFYAMQKFPTACVGPVQLLVTPQRNKNTVQVHVTCHPSIASTVYQSLKSSQLAADHQVKTTCAVTLVPARLNRLRLRGPESAQALLSILHAPASEDPHPENVAKLSFLRTALNVRDLSKHFQDGDAIALNLADPRASARVSVDKQKTDPDNSKQSQKEMVAALKLRPDVLAADSPLFDHQAVFLFEPEHEFNKAKHTAKVRKWEALFKTTTPFSTSEATSTNTSVELPKSAAVLPVLLIRKSTPMRSFKTQKHRLSGWDIVLPAVWGFLVFRHLQQHGGAAAVGSEEMDHLLAKSGIPTFPRDFPDTLAGRAFWDAHDAAERADNEKRPPLKRVISHNLPALLTSAVHPASGCSTYSTLHSAVDTSATLIVRGETYLRDFLPPPFEDLDSAELEEAARQSREQSNERWISPHIMRLPALPALMFLHVLLVPTSRGLILDLAELVCPSQEDVALFVRHKQHTKSKRAHARAAPRGRADAPITVTGLYRPVVCDASETAIASSGLEDLPKEWEGVKLARKRVVNCSLPAGAAAQGTSEPETVSDTSAALEVPTDASKATTNAVSKVKKVVPCAGEVVYGIGVEQGRKVIGTVTTGQKEHLNNTHFAVGLCNVNALNEMFQMSFGKYQHPQAHVLVLYRNARSDHLRPAVLQIV